jgi:hypothetical protein
VTEHIFRTLGCAFPVISDRPDQSVPGKSRTSV